MLTHSSSLILVYCVVILCHVVDVDAFRSTIKTNHCRFLNSLKCSTSSMSSSETKSKGGDTTVAATTFNIAKSIIGSGVLTLPSGVAFFADSPSALIPASLMCATMGLTAAYTFSSIGKACEQHDSKSFQDVWGKSVDPKTGWVLTTGITAKCFLASLAYSIVIGDSFSSIANTFHLPAVLAQRNNIILAFTTFVLYPLCSLKSLNSLAPFSLLGLSGTFYTAVFMAIRYFDGSYLPGGEYFKVLSPVMQPQFNVRADGSSVSYLCFILLSMLSTAFIAHYNAPKFYSEMKDTSSQKFNGAVTRAFGFSIAIFIFIMSMGFLTFGGASSGFVLNNYASTDSLASVARLAIGMALITSYPFTFSALRDGIMDLGKFSDEKRASWRQPLTIGLLAIVTPLAMVLKDVGFVSSISGAMFGSVIMFIVPALMNLNNLKKITLNPAASNSNSNTGTETNTKFGFFKRFEPFFNKGLIGAGISMGILGISISLLRQFGQL